MRPVPTIAAAVVVAATLTACGGKAKTAADAPPTAATPPASHATSSSSPTDPPPSSPTSSPKGTQNTFDPCQLVTRSEASTLAHASFGPGEEEGTKVRHACVYGAQTSNVLSVIVLTGATNEDAQAEWDQLLAEAQKGVSQAPTNVVHLTAGDGIGDRSEWVEADISQIGVDARGLAFLKGSVGVYLIDLVRGAAAPSRDAYTTEAQTVLSRLP
ncbi:MAG: DUF3558 family protein [Nocardioides sp.]